MFKEIHNLIFSQPIFNSQIVLFEKKKESSYLLPAFFEFEHFLIWKKSFKGIYNPIFS